MKRPLVVLLSAVLLVGCGEQPAPPADEGAAAESGWVNLELTPEPGFDLDDPAIQTIPDDGAHGEAIVRKAGKRKDFKVPASAVAGLENGPLVRAVVLRPFYDGEVSDRLNGAQLAVYAMYLADFEILNGGISQLWLNQPGIAGELVSAAERVGADEHAAIYRDAAALWPGGKIPADGAGIDSIDGEKLAALDERYAALQYRRATTLANVLGPYIRANTEQFVAG